MPRTVDDVRSDWVSKSYKGPGFEGDRTGLLRELVGMLEDATACDLINTLMEESERNAYALALVTMLLRGGNGARARNALLSAQGISRATRFSARVAIYAACRLEEDLRALRTVAEHMPPSEKPLACLTVFGLSGDGYDLMQAFQAMSAPVEAPRRGDRRR